MNKLRLLKLADLLEADAKNKKGIQFDMTDWGTVSDHKKPLSCGTQACAMGLAALSGAFKRAGLEAKIDEGGYLRFKWKGRHVKGFDAGRHLFDIDEYESDMLFGLHGGETEGSKVERAKAKQIRRFVKTGEI